VAATYIQSDGDSDEEHVHMIQAGILLQAICNKTLLNNPDEVEIEGSVHDGEEDLFHTIPNIVDMDVSFIDLKARRDPDTEDADIDGQENSETSPLEYRSVAADDHKQADTVDDDLNQTLDLD
jgi:hypothetical protein